MTGGNNMRFTDKTIEITCGECGSMESGLHNTMLHILTAHTFYTLNDAEHFAEVWMHDAYERQEVFENVYDEERMSI